MSTPHPRYQPIDGYNLQLIYTDPWQHPIAHVCKACGAMVADPGAHTADHTRQSKAISRSAGRSGTQGLSAEQLHTLAHTVRGENPPPDPQQDPGQYVLNAAVHRLAAALDKLAEDADAQL